MKYYDYDKWEAEEYDRKKGEAESAAAANAGNANVAADEWQHKQKLAQIAKQKKMQELQLIQQSMTSEKVEEMKHQARLRHEMAVAYKTGDEETRKKLQRRLEPEELVKR